MARKFRKRPVVIEAVQWTGYNFNEVTRFLTWIDYEADPEFAIWNSEEHQYIRVPEGHWIIKGVNGEVYPCSPDVFNKTYEEVA